MKKTFIATTVALLASASFANDVQTLEELFTTETAPVVEQAPIPAPVQIPAQAVEVSVAPVAEPVSVPVPVPVLPEVPSPVEVQIKAMQNQGGNEGEPAETRVEDLMLNPEAEALKLDAEIYESTTERNLDRLTRATSLLKEEEAKTKILQERMRRAQIYRAENEAIISQYERLNKVDAQNLETRRVEEVRAIEQVQMEQQIQEQLKPTITDDVNVYSIYGQKGRLFAELVINGTKYQVQKGHKMEGFTVKAVDDTSVTLVKNDVEQSFTISSKPSQFVSQERVEEPANIPNVIKPYELR